MLELDNGLKRQLGLKRCAAWDYAERFASVAKRQRRTRQGASTPTSERKRQAKGQVRPEPMTEYLVHAVTAKAEQTRKRIFTAASGGDAAAQARRLGWKVVSVKAAVRL